MKLTSMSAEQDAFILRQNALLAENAELVAALEDAEFLLRKVGINWKEAGSMSDSCLRSADDARAALARAGKGSV